LEDKLCVLIIGASGKVGKEIFKILKNKDNKSTYDVFGTYYTNQIEGLEQLDITNLSAVEKVLEKINPSVLIHTAAITYPLRCEENRELAWKINVEGTKNLAQCCMKNNCKMVFISSDNVFDGKNGPFDETQKTNPLNYYGETKVESEKIVSETDDYLIIRTAWVNDVGPNSHSFIMQVINSLQNNNIFNAPVDQFGHPTYSNNLAEIIIELVKNNSEGVFHVTGSTYVDRFHFAKKIAKAFCLNPEMVHKTTTNLHQSHTRPMEANMKLDKLKSVISTKVLSLDEQLDSMRSNYRMMIPINDVKLQSLGRFKDQRGSLSVLVSKNRNDAPNASKIEEVYISDIPNSGTIRAGHKHHRLDEFFVILDGSAKFVLVDDRKESITYKKHVTVFLNGEFRSSLFVPSEIFHVFITLENNSKCLAIASEAYDAQNPDIVPATSDVFGNEFDI
tara:strand:- start:2648 stop:3991 length:1344 start_codon:yes stop_codon:yes gene_type:complete